MLRTRLEFNRDAARHHIDRALSAREIHGGLIRCQNVFIQTEGILSHRKFSKD
jgi:hypothetical protein